MLELWINVLQRGSTGPRGVIGNLNMFVFVFVIEVRAFRLGYAYQCHRVEFNYLYSGECEILSVYASRKRIFGSVASDF